MDKSTGSRNQNQNHPVKKKHLKTKPRIASAEARVKRLVAERFLSARLSGAVQGAKRRSETLTARTDLESCEARGRGYCTSTFLPPLNATVVVLFRAFPQG